MGKLIIEGRDKILKVVAGKIITGLSADNDTSGSREELIAMFFPRESAGPDTVLVRDFPCEQGSQWEASFGEYVGIIEVERDKMNAP